MRLATETNSLVNHLLSGTRGAPQPEVGMGATILMWTDRRPATIVGLEYFKSGARAGQVSAVWIQEDDASRIDNNGMSEMQEYEIVPNPAAMKVRYKVNKAGAFTGPSGQLRIGQRSKYYDMSF